MISVCMGIYNGEKYIAQQLQSIMNQTRKADEVILCDDRSTDNTVKIAEKFIEENELADTWKIHQNIQNKGYPYNFYYVMGLCKGDIVFLADQDDVWDVHKIEKMSHIMETHEEIQLLASS